MTRTIRSIATLAAVAVAALAASFGAPPSAHALDSKATLKITKDPDYPGKYLVSVEGVIGASSVDQAQNWWHDGNGDMQVRVWGDDTIYDDIMVTSDFEIPKPTIAGLPFNRTLRLTGAQLNEDDYAGNRYDEIYAEIYKLDHYDRRDFDVPYVRTNTVGGYF